jgi:uncharacterized surface protein with fasciclin (FAS1) repeats
MGLAAFGFDISVNSQTPTATPTMTASPTPTLDIIDTAIANGRFTTLVAAIQAAGLVDTLKGAGPFTVFSPTDDAFKKLPQGTVDGLLKDFPTLKNILLYHVVSGKIMAGDILKVTTVDIVQTAPIDIGLTVNDAQVTIPGVMASNGVIHVIDTVLMPPPAATATPTASPMTTP